MGQAWTSDQVYIWDVTGEPVYVGHGVMHIQYGERGYIEASAMLPLGGGLYSVVEGATVELVVRTCGLSADEYSRVIPFVRMKVERVERWTELPSTWGLGEVNAVFMNVVWEGKVELLDAGKV